ncbi:MAG: hypothetical protein AAB853_00595 [Patescibacteria group bacterium]
MDGQQDSRQEKVSPVIVLDEGNTQLVGRLKSKLEEYKSRLAAAWEEKAYAAPESVNFASIRYKIAVLSTLLADGRVETFPLSQKLSERDLQFYPEPFNNACDVISSYVSGDVQNITGGTGLPPLEGGGGS